MCCGASTMPLIGSLVLFGVAVALDVVNHLIALEHLAPGTWRNAEAGAEVMA